MRLNEKMMKLLSLVLVVTFLLTGCGTGKSSDDLPDKSGSTTAADTTDTDGEAVELTLYMPGNNAAPASLEAVEKGISAITKEKINATVDIQIIEWGAYQEQLNLMLAGSEKMDLFITMSVTPLTYAQRGQLVPITDMIDQYAPDAKETLGKYLDACYINGELYGLPPFHDMASSAGLCARKDIVESVGVSPESVKTWDDVDALLSKVKAANPNMDILVPAILHQGILQPVVTTMFDTFGVSGAGIPDSGTGDLTVENIYATETYKEVVSMAKDWYQKGYILSDATTNTETRESLIQAGNAFGYIMGMKPGLDIQEKMGTGYDMVTIPLTDPILSTTGVSTFQWVVPGNSENPEKALEFYNILFTNADIQNYLIYGIEGTDYVISDEENNIAAYPEGVDSSSVGWIGNNWFAGNLYLSYVWEGSSPSIWEDLKSYNDSAALSPAYGFVYNSEKVKNELTAIANVESKYRALLESGIVDVEDTLQKFNKEMESAGIQNVIGDIQSQLDEWQAAQ